MKEDYAKTVGKHPFLFILIFVVVFDFIDLYWATILRSFFTFVFYPNVRTFWNVLELTS